MKRYTMAVGEFRSETMVQICSSTSKEQRNELQIKYQAKTMLPCRTDKNQGLVVSIYDYRYWKEHNCLNRPWLTTKGFFTGT